MRRRDQAHRDLAIAVGFALGASQAMLAEHYGVSERTARRAIARIRTNPELGVSLDAVDEYLTRSELALEDILIAQAGATDPGHRSRLPEGD